MATIAYAPNPTIIRKCVAACIETSQTFGGGSVKVACCTTNLCNTSPMTIFPSMSRILLFVFILLNFIKNFI